MTIESFKEDGRPAQQWYWDDWFSAFDVRLCSIAARGLWIDMLGIMWKAEIRGTLTVNGRQVNNKTLAKIAGATIEEVNSLIKELEDNDVFSKLRDGTIICRRLFKESKKQKDISNIRSEAGKKGAESRWQIDNKKNGKNITKGIIKKMAKMATSTSTLSSSATSTPNSKTYGQDELDRLFEKFISRYPRKDDEGEAKRKWLTNVVTNKVDPEKLEVALDGYINILNRNKTDPQYIKHAKTFLYPGNKKRKIPPTWEQFLPYADPKHKARPPL